MAHKVTLMGRKRGMTQLYDDKGNLLPCTVIQIDPNFITQLKTAENDGYNAIQLAFDEVKAKDPRRQEARTTKPMRGHFAKAGVAPCKVLCETRVDDLEGFELGQSFGIDQFEEGQKVDVSAVSKGKGYQGLMKKNNYRGGPAAHGSGFHRHAGSTGMRSTPGRCLPGGPRPSQMGNERVTVQSLKIVKIDPEEQVILVKGAVPGAINGLVYVASAVKVPVAA